MINYHKLMTVLRIVKIGFLVCASLCVGIFSSLQAKTISQPTKSKVLKETPIMSTETRYLIYCLDTLHYSNIKFDTLKMPEILESYMTELDPNHLFFLQADFQEFLKRTTALQSQLKYRGNLGEAFNIFERYRQRVEHTIEWIQDFLRQPIDFNVQETFTPDRRDADWSLNISENQSFWAARLKYELLNEIIQEDDTYIDQEAAFEVKYLDDAHLDSKIEIAKIRFKIESSFDEALECARERLLNRYKLLLESIDDIDSARVEETFLSSFAKLYDPHTMFFSSESMEDLMSMLKNSIVGIGALLTLENEYCIIKEVLPGGPADKSRKIRSSDRIVGVANGIDGPMVDVIGQKLRKIVKRIQGEKNSVVRLRIQPADGDPSTCVEITLVRDEIKFTLNLARAEVFEMPVGERTVSIGVIDLPAFYSSSGEGADATKTTTEDVKELIEKLKQQGVEALILDLRRNGGGFLEEAINLTSLFINEGPILQVRGSNSVIWEHINEGSTVVWTGPLMILASKHTASASEIVMGALKTHKRALIVGEHSTHGKGTVQAILEMNHLMPLLMEKPDMRAGSAKITIQKWYLPDGSSIQLQGVPSDISIRSFNDYLPLSGSEQLHALPWDSIAPMKWDAHKVMQSIPDNARVNDTLKEYLQKRSLERQENLEEFVCLNRYLDYFQQVQEVKAYSLSYEIRKQEKESNKAFRKHMKESMRAFAKNQYPSEKVVLDLVEEQLKQKERMKDTEIETCVVDMDTLEASKLELINTSEEDVDSDVDFYLREALRIMVDWLNFSYHSGN